MSFRPVIVTEGFFTESVLEETRPIISKLEKSGKSNAFDPEYAKLCADTARVVDFTMNQFAAKADEIALNSKKRAATDTPLQSEPTEKRARQDKEKSPAPPPLEAWSNAASSPVDATELTLALEKLDPNYSPTSFGGVFVETPFFHYAGGWARASSQGGSPVVVHPSEFPFFDTPGYSPTKPTYSEPIESPAEIGNYSPPADTPWYSFQGGTPKEFTLQGSKAADDIDPLDDIEFVKEIPVIDLSQD